MRLKDLLIIYLMDWKDFPAHLYFWADRIVQKTNENSPFSISIILSIEQSSTYVRCTVRNILVYHQFLSERIECIHLNKELSISCNVLRFFRNFSLYFPVRLYFFFVLKLNRCRWAVSTICWLFHGWPIVIAYCETKVLDRNYLFVWCMVSCRIFFVVFLWVRVYNKKNITF